MLDNTGMLAYQWLIQVDARTGEPTGLRKPNDPADPDYISPTENYDACPLPYTWEPMDAYCEAASYYCAPGYTLSADGTRCLQVNSAAATAPATPAKAVATTNNYLSHYVYIYSEYTNTGAGSPSLRYYDTFWSNPVPNTTDGAFNRCGLWVDTNNDGIADPVLSKWMGFVVTLDLPADEKVFIGIGSTTSGRILLTNSDGTARNIVTYTDYNNYEIWRMFQVQLRKGLNLIQLEGLAQMSAPLGFGAEIYRNTWSQLYYSPGENANIIWSTANFRGQHFHTGDGGYSCPAGYALDFNNGSPVCRQILVDPVKQHNTGKVAYRRRKRLLRGLEDGTIENNIQDAGTGPYFPPVDDTGTCPIN